MNKIVLSIFTAVIFIGFGIEAAAQDVHFSQYYANPVYLNPAYAGAVGCPRIVTNFRQQWPSISGRFTSYSASYDQHFEKIKGGIGVLFVGDYAAQSGHITTNTISVAYSFHAELTKKVAMRLALQATYQQKSLNFNKLTFQDMIDPKYGFIYSTAENFATYTKGIADFSTGLIFYSDHYYGGIAVHHFTQPKESFFDNTGKETRVPMKITGNFGAVIDLKKYQKTKKTVGDVSISPNLIFQYQSRFTGGAVYTTINYGTYVSLYPMVIGAWFRQGFKNADAAIFLAGVEYEFLKVGYSYDFTIPSTNNNKMKTGGAHEVSAQFYLPCPKKHPRIRNINCPKF